MRLQRIPLALGPKKCAVACPTLAAHRGLTKEDRNDDATPVLPVTAALVRSIYSLATAIASTAFLGRPGLRWRSRARRSAAATDAHRDDGFVGGPGGIAHDEPDGIAARWQTGGRPGAQCAIGNGNAPAAYRPPGAIRSAELQCVTRHARRSRRASNGHCARHGAGWACDRGANSTAATTTC